MTRLLPLLLLLLAQAQPTGYAVTKTSAPAGPQFARPTADLDNTGAWTPTPLATRLDDSPTAPDGLVVTSDGNPISSEVFVVALSPVVDKGLSTGYVIRARWAKAVANGADHAGRAELREGYVSEAAPGALVATLVGAAIADDVLVVQSYTLTGPEADSIISHAALSLRAYAEKIGGGPGREFRIDSLELEVP